MKKVFGLIVALSFALFVNGENINASYFGSWSGTIEGVGLELVFNIAEDTSTFDVPAEGAKGIPLVVKETAIGGVRLEIPSLLAYFEGFFMGKSFVGNYYQSGQQIPLTLKPYIPTAPNRPQTPKAPFAYESREVSFNNGEATLAGTLTLPQNASLDTPIVLFVTGSGSQNRDEEIAEHKPFWVLSDALANAGIASLRYDDRGFAQSTGDVINATTDSLAMDALQGVKFLRSLGYKKVGVIGHSEGGTIAFILASMKEVDFVVSLAGMAENGRETLINQTYAISIAQGADEDTAKAASKVVVNQMLQVGGKWGARFIELEPAEYLKNVTCPLLALNGENDKNVICERNIPIIKDLVPEAVIKTYSGLNHLFQPSKNGTATEYYSIETTISPEVIEDIISFILSLKN